MRRLVSESKRKRKQRFYQILFGIGLIFIMFSSIIGYGFISRDDEEGDQVTRNYHGVEFASVSDFWVANIGGYDFAFRYHPEDTPRIYTNISSVEAYYYKPLYIQSVEDISAAEIYTNLNYFVERMQKACLDKGNETICEGDLPVKNCSNNIIVIQEPEEGMNSTTITQNQSCVFITAPRSELVKATDEFLFKVLGID